MQDEMKRRSDNLPEGSIDNPGPDDIFSTVMGKDRNGDAGMFGLGVRASDVWGVTTSRSVCHRENNEPSYQRRMGRRIVPLFHLLHHNILLL